MSESGINLLPWRRAARRRQWKQLLVGTLGLILGVSLLAGIGNRWLLAQSRVLTEHMTAMSQEQASLQVPLSEARVLQRQLALFDGRLEAIARLEAQAQEGVRLFDWLAQQLPEPLRLREIRKRDRQLEISGLARSNEAVSTLMRRLEASQLLQSPQRLDLALEDQGLGAESHFRLGLGLVESWLPASWPEDVRLDALAGDPVSRGCATRTGSLIHRSDQEGCDAH